MAKVTPSVRPSVEEQAARIAAEQGAAPSPVTESTTKRAKVAKVVHPDALKGNLADVPTDYNPRLHKGLKPKQFANKGAFLKYKAWRVGRRISALEIRKAAILKEAETLIALANDPQAALKLRKAKLEAELARLTADLG